MPFQNSQNRKETRTGFRSVIIKEVCFFFFCSWLSLKTCLNPCPLSYCKKKAKPQTCSCVERPNHRPVLGADASLSPPAPPTAGPTQRQPFQLPLLYGPRGRALPVSGGDGALSARLRHVVARAGSVRGARRTAPPAPLAGCALPPPQGEGSAAMLGEDEFISSPPRKTVRFGGTLTDILLKYEKGETTDFELLKLQLSDPDIKDAQLINWLHEFRASVVYLTKELDQLVSILLKLPWLRRSREVVEEYLCFLGNLVSAQTVHLRPCLRMIVSQFVPPRITIREDDVDISDSDDDDENVSENFNTCHRALQTVARYVPSTPQFLMPILVENFPFINKSERTLECYVHNLLRVTVYLPILRLQILELIIEKLLKLDVSTPQQDIEDAEEAANNSDREEKSMEEGLFDMEEDEERKGNKVVSYSSERMAHPLAERLDILMTILFSYIKDVCHVDGKLDINRTKDLYRDLVSVFDKLILPTHASCHVQYFMFYICSFKLGLAEAFLDHLWKKLHDPNNPSVIRQTAGSYIGSFLARAKFIPVVTVKACLDLLVNWLHKYIDNQDRGANAYCDVALHGPFYSTCQAVFYTLIFRHKQLLDGNLRKGLSYLQSLNFERIIICQLNPLKICIPSVVNLFAAITRKYQLVFCYTIIERNNRQFIPVVRSGTGGDLVQTCTNPLESFFPFDPYLLKRSKKTIDPFYQFWEELSAEDLENLKKPIKKGTSEDEDDDFLKGETPQNDGVVGIAPNSYESNTRSPVSSIGSPVDSYVPFPQ